MLLNRFFVCLASARSLSTSLLYMLKDCWSLSGLAFIRSPKDVNVWSICLRTLVRPAWVSSIVSPAFAEREGPLEAQAMSPRARVPDPRPSNAVEMELRFMMALPFLSAGEPPWILVAGLMGVRWVLAGQLSCRL